MKSFFVQYREEKPCYTELLERIQAIWNAVCMWICDLANQLFSWETKKTPLEPPVTGDKTSKSTSVTISPPNQNLALLNQNCFCHMVRYLEPEDLARCERVLHLKRQDLASPVCQLRHYLSASRWPV